jgi:putative endonuclease
MFVMSLHPTPSLAKRRAAEQSGRLAEDQVAAYWAGQGFAILAQRMRTEAGEIDLVAASANALVFIEVKARKSYAAAAYALQPRQQARLLQAADIALADHPEWHRDTIRFDAALVCNGRIDHIEDAIRYN